MSQMYLLGLKPFLNVWKSGSCTVQCAHCAALNLMWSESCSLVSAARGLVSSSDPVNLPPSAIVGLENLSGLPRLPLGIGGALWIFLSQGPLDNGLVFPDG